MFFATLHGPDTDSALPQLTGFTYWSARMSISYSFLNSLINGIKKNCQISLASICAMQVKSIHIVRDMLQKVTSTNHVSERT